MWYVWIPGYNVTASLIYHPLRHVVYSNNKSGIHPVMPDPAPTAAIFPKIVRTHKHEDGLFNEYHVVDRVCKIFISQIIPEKHYKFLSSQVIGFEKVKKIQILTHLITKYA